MIENEQGEAEIISESKVLFGLLKHRLMEYILLTDLDIGAKTRHKLGVYVSRNVSLSERMATELEAYKNIIKIILGFYKGRPEFELKATQFADALIELTKKVCDVEQKINKAYH